MRGLLGTIGKKYQIIKGTRDTVRRYFKLLPILFFLECIILALQVAEPYFYKMFVDDVLIAKNIQSFYVVCIGKIGICVLLVLFMALNNMVNFNYINGIIYSMKKEILSIFINLSPRDQEKCAAGDIEEMVNQDLALFESYWKDQVINYAFNSLYTVVLLALTFMINWEIALFSCVLIPAPYIVSKLLGKFNYSRKLKRRKLYGLYENFLYESLQSWKEVKALALEKKFLIKFVDFRHKIARFDIFSGYCEVVQESVNFFSRVLSTRILVYIAGGLFVFNGRITIGDLFLFASYYELLYEKINAINKSNYEFLADLPSLEKVLGIFAWKTETYEETLDKSDIELSGVSFKYPQDDRYVLNHINMRIRSGEKVLITGESGCGKTTLLKLLLGIYPADQGSVKIGGCALEDLGGKSMSQSAAAVLQDSVLFNMTIRENLLLADPEAVETEIIEACKRANIYEYIHGLPEGFDTKVGENGVRMSGGQRQRIILARLFLTKTPILILDETTSALDPDSEKIVYDSLKSFGRDKTVIIVSHQLAALSFVDRCIVMKGGEIKADGKFKELLRNNKYFTSLLKRQNPRIYEQLKMREL